jgi:hypothetical protein
VGGVGDVVVEQSSLDGEVERGAHDDVDFEHGLGGEAVAVATAGGGEVLVEVVEVVGAQPSEWDLSDVRRDVVLDEPGVPVAGGRPDLAALVRQPGRTEELVEP